MPYIGSGLARDNWAKVEQMICHMAVKHQVLVLIYMLGVVEEQAAGAAQQGPESMVVNEREDKAMAALQVQHDHSGQWLEFERCVKHEVSTILVQAVQALDIKQLPIGGTTVLWVHGKCVRRLAGHLIWKNYSHAF